MSEDAWQRVARLDVLPLTWKQRSALRQIKTTLTWADRYRRLELKALHSKPYFSELAATYTERAETALAELEISMGDSDHAA